MIQLLRFELKLRLTGVPDVITRDFTASLATLEVISEKGGGSVHRLIQ
ncbi:MAG: hypothetical protein KAW14_09195 [Candidatus Aegiribacteria sp.]|nr:hypothetical protein [Candidatus Aegiribacteria sp.]